MGQDKIIVLCTELAFQSISFYTCQSSCDGARLCSNGYTTGSYRGRTKSTPLILPCQSTQKLSKINKLSNVNRVQDKVLRYRLWQNHSTSSCTRFTFDNLFIFDNFCVDWTGIRCLFSYFFLSIREHFSIRKSPHISHRPLAAQS